MTRRGLRHGPVWLVLAFLLGCALPPEPAAPPWTLVPATQAADARHLILTVPLDDPEALSRLAEEIARDHAVTLVAEWPLRSIDVHCFVMRLDPGAGAAETIAALAADPRVRTAQPMNRFATLARSDADLSGLQATHDLVDLRRAHRVATGRGVRVAVIDTLPDAEHPDLAPRVAAIRDFVADDAFRAPEEHGTAVAGLIGAEAGSGRGIVGVAPEAELLGLRACWEPARDGAGVCSSFSLARALNVALIERVDIVNMSLAGPDDPLLGELVAAARARGTVVVAAIGPTPERSFPAARPGVIAVGPWPEGRAARTPPHLRAPGEDVLSTAPFGEYDFFSGSSMAAAYVTGGVALLLELAPGLSAESAERALAGHRPVNLCRAIDALGRGRRCPQ
ncbi:MAG: S8 family serine peptidase [Paracoccaceae bacterium]